MSLYGLLVFSAVYMLAVATPGPALRRSSRARWPKALAARRRSSRASWSAISFGLHLQRRVSPRWRRARTTVFVVVKYAGAAYLLVPRLQAVDRAGCAGLR